LLGPWSVRKEKQTYSRQIWYVGAERHLVVEVMAKIIIFQKQDGGEKWRKIS